MTVHIIATYASTGEGSVSSRPCGRPCPRRCAACLLASLTTAIPLWFLRRISVREMGVTRRGRAHGLSSSILVISNSTVRRIRRRPRPLRDARCAARTASPKSTPIFGSESRTSSTVFLGRVYLINVRYPKVLLALFCGAARVSVYGYTLVEWRRARPGCSRSPPAAAGLRLCG